MSARLPGGWPESLLIAAVCFGPLAFGATENWSVAVLEALLFAAGGLVAARGVSYKGSAIDRTMLPAAIFLAALGAAQRLNPRSAASPAGFLPFAADPAATGRAVVLWGAYAALLFGAPRILASRAARVRMLWTVFILGAVIAVAGLIQKGQGNVAYYGLRPIRHGEPFGPYTNRDHAAGFLVLALFAGLGAWASRFGGFRRIDDAEERTKLVATQALAAFFLGVIAYAIADIGSRGAIHAAILGGLGASALFLLRLRKRTALASAALGLFAAAASYVVVLRSHPALSGYEPEMTSTQFRLSMYRGGLSAALDFPAFGTGLGTVNATFAAYKDTRAIDGRVDHVHNDWLELLMQSGLVGFVAFVGALAALLVAVVRGWVRDASFESRCVTAATVAGVVAFSLHGLVDFNFQIPANAVLFFIFSVSASPNRCEG